MSTILILLCVLLIKTKHLVNIAYVAYPPSAAQCDFRSGRYLEGSKVKGLSSKGIFEAIVSSAVAVDCNLRVFLLAAALSPEDSPTAAGFRVVDVPVEVDSPDMVCSLSLLVFFVTSGCPPAS